MLVFKARWLQIWVWSARCCSKRVVERIRSRWWRVRLAERVVRWTFWFSLWWLSLVGGGRCVCFCGLLCLFVAFFLDSWREFLDYAELEQCA